MHIEQLDGRRMFAVGLDPSFAGDGSLNAAPGGTVETSLSTSGALFVEQKIGTSHYIFKYDGNGALSSSWGTSGRVTLGTDITHLAYDSTTGDLYAAGVGTRSDGTRATMVVYRFLANGNADTRFGTAGNTQYTIASAGTDQAKSTVYSAVLSVSQLIALPGRQVIVGMTRAISAYHDTLVEYSTTVTGSVGLMRFRYNGQIDRTFGGGYVPVLSTSTTSGTYEFNSDGTLAESKMTDLVRLRDGSFRVILTRETGVFSSSNASNGRSIYDTSMEIKSRVVSSLGQISTTEAFSWNLLKRSQSNTQNRFSPLLAKADAGTGVTVIGRYDYGTTTPDPLRAIQLKPGQRNAVTTPFSDTGIAYTKAVRSEYGFYFLGDDDGHVARYRPDFRRDTTFARRGVGTSDRDDTGFALVPDTYGDVLLAGNDRIERIT